MKSNSVTNKNFNPKDWMGTKNQTNTYAPAYAYDYNRLRDDVSRLYSNFKSATSGAFTAATGATASFSISDSDVDSDTKIVMTVTSADTSAGYPVVASAIPSSDSITVTIGNVVDSNLDVTDLEVNYFIDKELS